MRRSARAALFINVSCKLVGCRLRSVCANDRQGERRVGRLGVTRPPQISRADVTDFIALTYYLP